MVASNGPATRIDMSRPYGRVFGTPGVAFAQDGAWYDVHGSLVLASQDQQSDTVLPPTEASAAAAPEAACAPADTPRRSPAAERMQVSRQRRRDGLRCIPLEIRDDEIGALVKASLLGPDARNNRNAIAIALGKLMDQLPPEWWIAPPTGAEPVTLNLTPGFIDLLVTLGWLPAAAPRDRATIKAAFAGFSQRFCTLSVQTPAPSRADRNTTGR